MFAAVTKKTFDAPSQVTQTQSGICTPLWQMT
jgi:hypothetical protein